MLLDFAILIETSKKKKKQNFRMLITILACESFHIYSKKREKKQNFSKTLTGIEILF